MNASQELKTQWTVPRELGERAELDQTSLVVLRAMPGSCQAVVQTFKLSAEDHDASLDANPNVVKKLQSAKRSSKSKELHKQLSSINREKK